MSEEVAASIGDVLAENARLKQQIAQAEERARIASATYHQQQDTTREHEARYQAAIERALAAEAERAQLRQEVVKWRMMVDFQAKMLADETALSTELLAIAKAHHANYTAALDGIRRLVAAWRAERKAAQMRRRGYLGETAAVPKPVESEE